MHEYELYGASLFETLLADKGRFWRLQHHWKRLLGSARALHFKPPTFEAFQADLLAAHDPCRTQVLRYSLLRLGGIWSGQPMRDQVTVLARDFTENTTPFKLHLPEERFANDDGWRQFKTGSRIGFQHLLFQARQAHCDDSLCIDREGRILETCYGNILWCESGRWFTPRLDLGVLPGIYREWLFESGLVEEGVLFLEELEGVNGLLVCNSVRGARTVHSVGRRTMDQTATPAFLLGLPKRHFQSIEP